MRPETRQAKNTPPPPDVALQRLGVPLDSAQTEALQAYSALVRRWNDVAGLVSRNDLRRFFARHLLDSLVLAPLIREFERPGPAPAAAIDASAPIADLGSGAGLPGIPLAVALPEQPFLLVERSEKKARFLRRVRDELTLRNVSVRCADFRALPGAGCRGAVARAVMAVPSLWRHVRGVLKPGGYLLVLDRLEQASNQPPPCLPEDCAGGVLRRHWRNVPESGAWHGVIEIRGISP